MKKDSRIYVAGHMGLVGSAVVRALRRKGFRDLLLSTHSELDLTWQDAVEDFFEKEKPEYVFLAAGKVGGIYANNAYPAQFIRENLMIQSNVIHSSYMSGVTKMLFVGSSCIYPKYAKQPIREEYLLGGPLEPTNEPYAVAKIAGVKMCQAYNHQYGTNYISAMPTNLYGPNDNYDSLNSHVLPALIRRFHEAKVRGEHEVVVWGSGRPRREFLYADDLAEALVLLMQKYEGSEIVNVGSGMEVTIKELAQLVKDAVGFKGKLGFDPSQPDGTPRKLLEGSKMRKLGWKAKTSLKEGLKKTYGSYLAENP